MTNLANLLKLGSRLCDGYVTDASRLTGPGPWAGVVPGQQAGEDTAADQSPAIRACRQWCSRPLKMSMTATFAVAT
jgi:hypothetical protein